MRVKKLIRFQIQLPPRIRRELIPMYRTTRKFLWKRQNQQVNPEATKKPKKRNALLFMDAILAIAVSPLLSLERAIILPMYVPHIVFCVNV